MWKICSLFSILLCLALLEKSSQAADYPFYAFQNGVRVSGHEAKAALLGELGYDGIGSARLPGRGETESLFATYHEKGLKIFSFYTGVTLHTETISTPPDLLRVLPELKGRGATIELFVKGNREKDRDSELVSAIRALADLAETSGTRIILYPHTGMYVETLSDAVRVARLIDRENVGVMFNLCHFLRVQPEADLKKELESAGPLLQQVSISGADMGVEDWPSLIQPLGRGTYDVEALFAILKQMEFDGAVGLQCFNIQGKSREFLAESIEAWKRIQ